ncbi:transmembrane protein 130 isoform X3 [Erythrolamprus reginae]|uniref:transmembrane protein 130 isoform X3 n=1 Tax=Erythrolamprus reginae TaxID=121349 RepID=UPI00396C614A
MDRQPQLPKDLECSRHCSPMSNRGQQQPTGGFCSSRMETRRYKRGRSQRGCPENGTFHHGVEVAGERPGRAGNSSPPLGLCWLIKTECIPLGGDQCHLVVMNSTQYYLNATFKNAGQYCLSIRVENRVNILQSYQEIQIRPYGIPPVFFILPCVVLLLATLGLAIYMTFRRPLQQKDLVEVADFDFSPTSTKKPSSARWSWGATCCQTCSLWSSPEPCQCHPAKEHHRLLQPLCKSRQPYSA